MSQSSLIKVFVFAALVLIFAFLFWQKLANVYLKANFSFNSLFWLGIWLLVFLVFLLFLSLLAPKFIALLIYFFSLATFFLFFPFHYYLLIGLALFFLVLILAHTLMQKERNERLKICLRSIFKRGLTLILLFLALFIGLVDYFYPLLKMNQDGVNLPPQILELILKPLSGTLSKTLPVFDPNIKIDEALAMTLVLQKSDLGTLSPELIKKFQGKDLEEINSQELLKDPEIAEILKKQAKKIDLKILAKQRNEVAKNFGIELKGNEKIAEVINKLANKQLQNLLGPYLKYWPIISAILTFIVLSSIFVPFSWMVILVTLFIFMILKIFRFVRIEKVMKEGEDVRW